MPPITASGRWFDGRSAAPHGVTLRLGARLEITGPGVHRDWNLADLRAGEAQAPLLRLTVEGDPGQVEVVDETFAAVLATRCPDLRRRADTAGGTWRLVLGSLVAGIAILLTVAFGLPVAAGFLAPLVPDAVEARLGAAVEEQALDLMGDPPPCADPAGRAVLDRLVARLASGRDLPSDLAVTVRRHGTANALTLPGARVVVLSELIAKARSADEFAGVLAHELGHVALRDPTRALIQASGTSFLLSLVLGDLTGSTVIVAFGQAALSAGYSRDAERAADAYSVATMRAAGGDAAALATMLERIAKDDAEADPAFLRTHPFTRERAATIRALAGSSASDRRILSEPDWAALRRICPGAKEAPDKPAPKPRQAPGRRALNRTPNDGVPMGIPRPSAGYRIQTSLAHELPLVRPMRIAPPSPRGEGRDEGRNLSGAIIPLTQSLSLWGRRSAPERRHGEICALNSLGGGKGAHDQTKQLRQS